MQNMGNYRGQVKARRRLGMNPSLELRPGIYNALGKAATQRLQEAARARWCWGRRRASPSPRCRRCPRRSTSCTSPAALVGAPINVVKAKTVDLLVPAEAEIVIEGFIDTEYLEPEAPFGESHGHVNLQEYNAYMDVTAITRRRDAILTSIISQVTPSESSLIKRIGMEPLFLNYLRNTLGIKGIKRVSMHEPLTNIRKVIALICRARHADGRKSGARSTARAVLHRAAGKYIIAVNDDIDPDNADAILWAMSYRANPTLDLHILPHRDQGHGPRSKRNGGQDASVLIDATLKEDFPPISLPKRAYMERAKEIWDELGLPKLKPEAPWFGYSLGEWSPRARRSRRAGDARRLFRDRQELQKRRRKDVAHEHRGPQQHGARREGKAQEKALTMPTMSSLLFRRCSGLEPDCSIF